MVRRLGPYFSDPGENRHVVTIAVRVKPGSARTRVGGGYAGPYGPALVVAVHAPAVDGRATEAARRALAEALGLRASAVTLRSGAASRDKLFTVAEPPTDLEDRVRRLREPAGGP
ncbi:DUF167 domain-containing protein [Planosporangium sp. 12N6]|uniref:DUF167 domain-containing protein n=1 Tax=Planosporangium spinosum TaxID=3402278 RepID=UPI003CF9A99E